MRKRNSFAVPAITVIALAGLCILSDSRTWNDGGMNGLLSMVVGAAAIFILIILAAAYGISSSAQSSRRKK